MWFLERVGRSMENLTVSGEGPRPPGVPRAHLNVLTPDRIPAFFIPPALPVGRAVVRAGGPHIIEVEHWSGPGEEEDEEEEEEGRLSRVPLRANPAEIVYLRESPHTRRKESLFHSHRPGPLGLLEARNPAPGLTRGLLDPCNPAPGPRRGPLEPRNPALGPLGLLQARNPAPGSPLGLLQARDPGPSPAARLRASSSPDSDTPPSSADSSPFGSPLPRRPWTRRPLGRGGALRSGSVSTDECSSAESSPAAPRRPARAYPVAGGNGRACCSLAPPPAPLYPPDFARRPRGPPRESSAELDSGGRLRLSADYAPESRRLRLRLVSGEGLYPASFRPSAVACCVVLGLLPTQAPKQRSTVIKRSLNPIFNEDFFFEGVDPEDLQRKAVKVKVLNKGSGLRRDCLMGETRLDLAAIVPSLHPLTRG